MENLITIITFYKFVDLPNYQTLLAIFKDICIKHHIKGTILLSKEGINGTVAGYADDIKQLVYCIQSYDEFKDLNYKFSYYNKYPFRRLKINLKKEIVTLGISDLDVSKKTGDHVKPEDWNSIINDPNTITIDTRNYYEIAIGSFKNAINPNTKSFREFPKYFEDNFSSLNKDQKIAMYCTGGIRCEKSTAYLKKLGFNNVYQLQGGILNYLANISPKDSLWIGECFLFDNRIGVDHLLQKGQYSMCYGCRHPISLADQQDNLYQPGIHCPHCVNSIAPKTIKRATERHKQILLAKKQSYQQNNNLL